LSDPSSGTRIISGLGGPPKRSASPVSLPLDPRTHARADDCVHCGLCLPACPTYTTNGLEADSPRGRIMLIKGMAEGKVEPTDAVLHHLELCLDCRACETACPSGVVYHELIEEAREHLAPNTPSTTGQRMVGRVTNLLFPYPGRLKLSLLMPRLLQRVGLWGPACAVAEKLLPAELGKMQRMLPTQGPLWEKPLRPFYPATSQRDGRAQRVGFFAGCVGNVLFQEVNRQSIALLQHVGCDVTVATQQQCCGAMHHHNGDTDRARAFARRNIDAFLPRDVPEDELPGMIVTNIAGCGAMLRDYAHLLRDDDAYAERARMFEDRVRDISEALLDLDLQPTRTIEATATYHDACHLLHAQKVADPPRELLSRIDGLELVPLPEADMCCGAAGTYNLTQPEMAMSLGERKLGHIHATGASLCVTGNVGCAMQIESEGRRLGKPVEVAHPVTLLHRATMGG